LSPSGPYPWSSSGGGRAASAPAVQERPQPQRTPESFKGRVVIVTGGATGLGRAVALEFAQSGCGVAFNYVEMPGREVGPQAVMTEAAIKACGVPCYSALCDVREMELVEHFVGEVRSHLGGVHYLVNNAGVTHDGALWRLTPEAWSEVIDTNLTGTFNYARAVMPEMLRRDAAQTKIAGIAPVIEAVQERYRKELAEILGNVSPYATISEIEIRVNPEDAPTDVLLEVFQSYFVDQPHQFSVSLYHYILHRLGAQKDASALNYCIEQLYIRPQETQQGLDYISAIDGYCAAYPLIERFLISEDSIYDYQKYQIFRWLNSSPIAPSTGLLTLARQLTFDMARPGYLRAVCRRVLQDYGTIADIDRLEQSYGDGRNDFERAQILVSLKGMEPGRRNGFYGRAAEDGLLCSRAVRLVRQGRL